VFETENYEVIMQRALSRVPNDVDKRQGSIIWDALAPACAEIAQMYIELNNILNLTFAETSHGEWLEKRCREMGVHRQPATHAIRLGVMTGTNGVPFDVPIGARFSIETVTYVVISRNIQGQFQLRCEQVGTVGNRLFGRILPIDSIRGLVGAEIEDILIPGSDAETDESLFRRYEERVNIIPFGGNIDDYTLKVNSIEGVGACKIIPVWNGGGTVKVLILDSAFNTPSSVLIEQVQEILDPVPFAQQGRGNAPIGHLVTVKGVEDIAIHINGTLVLSLNTTIGQISEEVERAIEDYLFSLRKEWSYQNHLVVRVAQLLSIIINIRGVEDVKNLTINGQEANLPLADNQIPVKGVVNLHE